MEASRLVTRVDPSDEGEVVERGWDAVFADAIEVLTEAARLRRPSSGDPENTQTEPVDFAEFISLVMASTAANVGGIEELLAGRPGSWEADHLRNLLTSTVGHDEQYLWGHRTEPVVISVRVDQILSELGIWELFDDSSREVWRLQEAVADDLTETEREAELDRLAGVEDDLETLMAAEWTAYGDAFRASVLAELEREPIPGLRVPVEFDIDPRPWQPYLLEQEPVSGQLTRLYEAGWVNTPLPGSGMAPKDYPSCLEIARVERAAGRLPHLRLPRRPSENPGENTAAAAVDGVDEGRPDGTDGDGGEWR
jgi:hypothetical protein